MYAIATVAKWSLAVTCVAVCISCTAVAHHAAAQPPGFPAFAYFSTPYNIQCWFEVGEAVPVWQSQDINCLGDLPDGDPCMVW